MKTGGAWQAIERDMWWDAESHEDGAQTFVEADPQRDNKRNVKGVKMC